MPRAGLDMPRPELLLLGRLQLVLDGQNVSVRRRKALLLLAYLALERTPHPREKIAALFWGDSTDAQARLSLRVALADLRKVIHPRLILADLESIQLNPDVPLWTDAEELERIGMRIRALPISSERYVIAEAQSALESVYRGELLPGFYDEWIPAPRERFQTLYLDLLLQLTHLWRAAGEYTRAIASAQRVLERDRANEPAHQHLIVCYAAQGDRSAALAQYESAERTLSEELGVEPSAETRALVERIQRETIGGSSAAPFTNLPKPLTSFVGRTAEISEIRSLLQGGREEKGKAEERERGGARVVTLTGVGGSGKTRLAIEAARTLVNTYADGVWWVELASLSDGTLLAQAVAKILGVEEESNTEVAAEQRLGNFLRARHALIVLDNCEHLVAESASLVEQILHGCPAIQFLVTSREGLGLNGETVYAVPNLAMPEAEAAESQSARALMEYPAVQLLVERAGHAVSTFSLTDQNREAVTHICQRLDGIPLALEIAAARLREMSVESLVTGLDERFQWLAQAGTDAPSRQQTLRALFDWSYELVSPAERALFRRLAVFRGGFDADAAVAIAYGKVESNAALDELGTTPQQIVGQLLNLLTEKSLLGVRQTAQGLRYEMLETVREYAQEKLMQANEEHEIRTRHLAHYDRVVGGSTERLFSPEQIRWLDMLDRDHSNLRAALQFAESLDAVDTLVRMAGQLGPFWQLRNYWTEGRAWIRMALERAGEAEPTAPLAKAYACAGVMAWLQGDYTRALARHEKALDLYRYIEEPWGISNSLNNVALQYEALGDYEAARGLYDEALGLARELDHARLILRVLNNLCSIAYLQGDLVATEEFSREALTRARAFGDKYALAIALVNRAQVSIARGALEGALEYGEEALAVAEELGNREFEAEALRHKAMAYLKQGNSDAAKTHFGESLKLAFDLGAKRQITWSLEGLALVAAERKEWVQATQLFAAATTLRGQIAIPKDASEMAEHAVLLETLRGTLGQGAFEEAWHDGERMELAEVVRKALSSL